MSEPLKENAALETEVIAVAIELFDEMRRLESSLPRSIFEKYLRPHLRLAFLKARRAEAERCETYRVMGSPRIIELTVAEEFVSLEIAKIEAERKRK